MKKNKGKVLILGSTNMSVFKLRSELIEALQKSGFDVVVAFQSGKLGDGKTISKEHKCAFYEVKIDRRGKNPFHDLKLLNKYKKIIKEIKPDIVLAFTAKCDIYGGLACRMLKVTFYPNITGLGKGLTEGKLTKIITKFLYKISIKKSKCVFFQNESDKKFFIDNKIKFQKSIVLPGSGVNLEKFKPLDYPNDKKIIFTYIARVMKAKGIDEFLEAARTIRKDNKNIEFHICGYCEEDYKDIIDNEVKNKNIIYHGLVDDVIEYEKMSHCIVLPSFHPEGISNVLLEAAASARPIITTNNVGCKDTIIDGKTGYIVEMKSSDDLIRKMEKFINLPLNEKEKMGIEGRKKIEKEFDRNIVIDKYMMEMEEVR